MKVNKINVIYKRVLQMRQFEPAEISVSIEAQVDPADKPETVIANIRGIARFQVEAERDRLLDQRQNTEDDREKPLT